RIHDRAHHLAAVEGDLDPDSLVSHCARSTRNEPSRGLSRPHGQSPYSLCCGADESAALAQRPGETTSERTPWTESGWTEPTSRPKSAGRGCSSIRSAPASARHAIAAATSGTS